MWTRLLAPSACWPTTTSATMDTTLKWATGTVIPEGVGFCQDVGDLGFC